MAKKERQEVYTSDLWDVTGIRSVSIVVHVKKDSVEIDIGRRPAVLRWDRMKPMVGKRRIGEGSIMGYEEKP
jgi:hypothetical protein